MKWLGSFLCLFLFLICSSCAPSLQLNSIGHSSKEEAREYFNKGRSFFLKNDYLHAVEMFEKSHGLDPDYLRPLRAAMFCYFQLGDRDTSQKSFYFEKCANLATKLISVDKETADGHTYLWLMNYTDPNATIYHLSKVIATPPNPTESLTARTSQSLVRYYSSLGYAYGAVRDYEKCAFYLKKYVNEVDRSKTDPQLINNAMNIASKAEQIIVYSQAATRHAYPTSPKPPSKGTTKSSSIKLDSPVQTPTASQVKASVTPSIPLEPTIQTQKMESSSELVDKLKDEFDVLFEASQEHFFAQLFLRGKL